VGLIDTSGRRINYLRLSVTDRCNLRCCYCMPEKGVPKVTHGDILRYEDLLRVARAAVSLGIEKIRVTGGEPLVRLGIAGFLARLAAIPGLRQLVLTTNGVLLEEMATDLRSAGVQRLNVSLDSLRPETFRRVTRCGDVSQVFAGLEAAERAGFPLKLNMVVMRGVNDDELADFAALTLDKPYAVRFIEYMPTVGGGDWQSRVVPGHEILERIGRRFPFVPLERNELAGPAREFQIEGAAGTFGIITPISGHFCGDCNRIRVTASGHARSCLFAPNEVDLKPFLLSEGEAGIRQALLQVVGDKPGRHRISDAETGCSPFMMSSVGG
jgi:cyclic pyranopterin phosphate synthase